MYAALTLPLDPLAELLDRADDIDPKPDERRRAATSWRGRRGPRPPEDPDLGRCQPAGRRPAGVPDQVAEEALDRTHQRPMDHHGSALAIAGDVLRSKRSGRLKPSWMVDSCRPADGVLDVDVDLAVERAASSVM